MNVPFFYRNPVIKLLEVVIFEFVTSASAQLKHSCLRSLLRMEMKIAK